MTSIGADYFGASDDEEVIQNDSNTKPLAWRGDPQETHSDWTIIINDGNDESSKTFHVHKVILSAGPRACEYFSTLFATQMAEQEQSTSHITLDKEDAKVFPVVLDFLYSGTLNATTDNAVSLRSLARYFQCGELMKSVNAFIRGDLRVETAVTYLQNATKHSDDRLKDSAKKLIAENFEEFGPHSFDSLSVELFRSIVSSLDLTVCCHDAVLSRVCEFFRSNLDSLNPLLLIEMTENLSEISEAGAPILAWLLLKVDPRENTETCVKVAKLWKNCTDKIVTNVEAIDSDTYIRKFAHYLCMPGADEDRSFDAAVSSLMVPCLLGSAFDRARDELTRTRNELTQAQEEIAELKVRNEELENQMSKRGGSKRKR